MGVGSGVLLAPTLTLVVVALLFESLDIILFISWLVSEAVYCYVLELDSVPKKIYVSYLFYIEISIHNQKNHS